MDASLEWHVNYEPNPFVSAKNVLSSTSNVTLPFLASAAIVPQPLMETSTCWDGKKRNALLDLKADG